MVDTNICPDDEAVKPAFTPGPWFAGKSEGRGALCVQSATTWICGEIDNRSDHIFDPDEAVANAFLIAASPCQNAALIKAEEFIAGFEGDEMQEGIDELLTAIRDALAKALPYRQTVCFNHQDN